MKNSNKVILIVLYVISWIIFVGISIEAGGFLTNFVVSIVKPDLVDRLWHQVDLTALYQYDKGYYLVATLTLGIVSALKALLFYLIINVLHNKKILTAVPFDRRVSRSISQIAYLSLSIGLFYYSILGYMEWFTQQGVAVPDLRASYLNGADVWLFMSVILFVISYIYRRGMEIQEEHELTV